MPLANRILIGAVVAVAAGLLALPAASAAPPDGTTPITVTAGATTGGIDADLETAAALSGTVTGGDGKPVAGATISLFDARKKPVDQGDYDGNPFEHGTGSTGGWTVPALSAGTYYVCVRANRSFYDRASRNSATYVDTCLGGVTDPLRGGDTVPAGAATVTLARAQHRTGVDVVLPKGAAISGTVRATTTSSDHPLSTVSVYNLSTGDVMRTTTGQPLPAGQYLASGLAPSAKGYTVCFDPRAATPVSSKLGYLGQCWRRAAWTPGGPQTPRATALKVRAGTTLKGIDASLAPAGAISGRVRYTNGDGTGTVEVRAFSATGRALTTTSTGSNGTYKLRGLPYSRAIKVCVLPLAGDVIGRCWRTARYSSGPPPKGAANIAVNFARTTSGIDIGVTAPPRPTYPKRVTISGTLSLVGGGAPNQVTVTAFDATTLRGITSAQTAATGSADYTLDIPRPGSFLVCAGPSFVNLDASTPAGPGHVCFGAAWDGGGGPPSTATRITLAGGAARTGVDLALPRGGAVAGHVTGGGHGVFSQVSVVDTAGRTVAAAYPYDSDTGAFRIVGITPASGYRICFRGAANDPQATGDLGRLPECFDNVPWDVPVPQAEYGTD